MAYEDLLIHSAKVSVPVREFDYGSISCSWIVVEESLSCRFVRKTASYQRDLYRLPSGEEVMIEMYMHCLPNDNIKEGNRVEWLGRVFLLVSVREIFDQGDLHHLECGLVQENPDVTNEN